MLSRLGMEVVEVFTKVLSLTSGALMFYLLFFYRSEPVATMMLFCSGSEGGVMAELLFTTEGALLLLLSLTTLLDSFSLRKNSSCLMAVSCPASLLSGLVGLRRS